MAPPAVMLRAVVADTAWLAIVNASPTPMLAVDAPVAVAPAVVAADAVWVPVALNAPDNVRMPLVPSVAVVVTFESVIAIAGVRATLPPAAPIFAVVVAASAVVAARPILPAPVTVTPSAIAAVVSSVMIANATEAPNPTLPVVVEPAPTGNALVVVVDVLAAETVRVPGFARATGPLIVAVVVRFTMSNPSAPATLTPPEPAPLDAAAPNECVPAAPPAPGVMVADTTKPVASAIESPAGRVAVFVTFAKVIATPAPIPALDAAEAEPSAPLVAEVAAELASVTTPPELITIPVPSSVAVDDVVARSIPIAAATDTLPSEVDADGDAADPEPAPPFAVATASALSR